VNRLTDDQFQTRIRQEAEAVEHILRLVRQGYATWVSSAVLEVELSRNPDLDRRHDVKELLVFANEVVEPGAEVVARAKVLESLGYGVFDAFHLACAESAKVDVFLTADDDLLRRSRRSPSAVGVRVANSLSWWAETRP